MTPRARKRAVVIPPAPPFDDVELANLELPPAPSMTDERRERELEDVISELGSDGRIKVWSVVEGKATYAGDMSAEGFTLDALLDAYGGGDKSLVMMQGRTKVDTFKVSLDPSIPAKNPRQPKAVAVTGNGPAALDMTNMMAMMMKSSLDSAQAMNTMMTGIMGALTTVMTATKPTTDPMEMALKMAEAMKGGRGDATEAMAMFREGLQLAERFGGGKDDDDGVMPVVGKGMDMLASLIDGIVTEKKAKAAAQVRVIPPPDGAAHEQPLTTESVPVARNDSVRPWVDAARPNIGALLKASAFLPPHAAASAIDNMLSDEQFEDLLNDIHDQANGGFGARLAVYFPAEIDGINAEWIGQVVEVLMTEFVEEGDEPDVGGAP